MGWRLLVLLLLLGRWHALDRSCRSGLNRWLLRRYSAIRKWVLDHAKQNLGLEQGPCEGRVGDQNLAGLLGVLLNETPHLSHDVKECSTRHLGQSICNLVLALPHVRRAHSCCHALRSMLCLSMTDDLHW